MEDELQKIVEEIEAETLAGKTSAVNVFRSMLYQPDLAVLSSVDATQLGSTNGFSTMEVRLPRPMLQVDTIQLVNANIPQCVQNIPDTSCVFWYYKTSLYSGTAPNPENLYMVRLLPTKYKPEFLPDVYACNKTFQDYQSLSTELALACLKDIGYDNIQQYEPEYTIPFLPNEIEISYNSDINKFQFIGKNAYTGFLYRNYSTTTTYALGDMVFIESEGDITAYKSLQNGNLNQSLSNEAWWIVVPIANLERIANWDTDTPYPAGRYVSYDNVLYISIANTIGNIPSSSPSFWSVATNTGLPNYRYLLTGFADPNVAFLQSTTYKTWNPFALYEDNTLLSYNNHFWRAMYQNKGIEPFSIVGATAWNGTQMYQKGDVVSYSGVFYKAIVPNSATTPANFSSVWLRQAWSVDTEFPHIVGLSAVTSIVDLIEYTENVVYVPFPVGVAGQPIVPTPKRLLNSILGFTWNGIFDPSLLAVAPVPALISSSTIQTQVYNRLRPIPQYTIAISSGLGVSAQPSTTTQIYTAEGYCNLVFSSVCYVYADIVGGSTLNTNRNTGLLGLVPMNAGNLGVAFSQQTITQPLSLNGEDLYSITLGFYDEFGEEYIFTNNAVLSFMLKITYKNKVAIR